MSAGEEIVRALTEKMADARAHRIATVAAEEIVRGEWHPTGGIDEYRIPQCQADEHMLDCIGHLRWSGDADCWDTDDGYFIVRFKD